MKIVLLFILLSISSLVYAGKNFGHALGNYAIPNLPENSEEIYEELIRMLPIDPELFNKVKYIEFDMRELETGELIVFHDSCFKKKFGLCKKKISKSSFDEIKDLCLKKSPRGSCFKIPTVRKILEKSRKLNKSKRVMIEIKHISNRGKDKLITLMNEYKKDVDMDIIIGIDRFKDIFTKKWCLDFNNSGYSVMQTFKEKDPRKNNLCNE